VQQAATVKGVRLHILKATDEDEFEPAFAALLATAVPTVTMGCGTL
jgi:hypothetical protein